MFHPNNQTFITQASAIQFESKGGLLLIGSKDEYRARFATGRSKVEKNASRSPDHWDSFVLTFTPARAKAIAMQNNHNELGLNQGRAGWRPLDGIMGY